MDGLSMGCTLQMAISLRKTDDEKSPGMGQRNPNHHQVWMVEALEWDVYPLVI